MQSRRTFPRIAKQLPVTFRRRRGATCRATSTTVSCEGASISLQSEQAGEITRGERVTVGVAVGGDILALPAVVAWVCANGTAAHIGLKLMLPLADSASRYAYADWIVSQTRTTPHPRATRRSEHSVVPVRLSTAQRLALRNAS